MVSRLFLFPKTKTTMRKTYKVCLALLLLVVGVINVNAEGTSLHDVPFWEHLIWGDEPMDEQASECAWVIGKPTDLPYGDVGVNNFADLSGYSTLVVTVADDTNVIPRFLFNRDVEEGQWNENESESHLIDNTRGGWSSKYFSQAGNVYTVDLEQMVADKGYAYLHAIKGANFENITVESMILTGQPSPLIGQFKLKSFPFWQHKIWGNEPMNEQASECAWVIGKPTDLPYGDVGVNNFADLSGYSKLIVTLVKDTNGMPRFLFNRDEDEGQWSEDESESHLIDNTREGWSSKYFTQEGNVYTADIEQMVKDKGYAHLHAIKGANFEAITVKSMVVTSILVNRISLNKTAVTMSVATKQQIEASVSPNNATDDKVTWSSSNDAVASVSSDGLVSANHVGTATITCTANDGSGVSASCEVSVMIPVTGVKLDKSSLSLFVNKEATLTATILPDNATDKTVTWTSSNTDVATVSSDGKVTAKAKGTTVITCTSNDNSKASASCSLTVVIPVASITLDKSELTLYLYEEATLTATVLPEDATNKAVEWQSDNSDVAAVSNDGKVTAKAEGTTTITCTAKDGGGATSSCVVNVIIRPTAIVLPATAEVTRGETISLTPTVTPANAMTTLTWTSDDESIATVDADGVVTGVKKGMTFIVVKTDNGLEAECKLTVSAPEPIAIEIPGKLSVAVGETVKVDCTFTPDDAETTVTWTVDDETIATIDDEGNITGKAEGLVVVKTSTANGITSNSCRVTVTAAAKPSCDVNGDGSVDVADIASVISFMAGEDGITKAAADVNGDGSVDVADIATIITRMAELARRRLELSGAE